MVANRTVLLASGMFVAAILSPLPVIADFREDLIETSKAMQPAREAAERLVVEGRLAEANQRLLDVFPKESRTAIQALVLGNVLFTQNSEVSYELHRQAAQELPDEVDAQFEWALEQHRAAKYAGAAAAYAKCVANRPNFAPPHALLAECLIRQGKTREAAVSWRRSERARQGTIAQFESLVCDVNGHLFPDRDRFALREKVREGDIDSAAKLIALDTDFRIDWWNAPTREEYLKHDLDLVKEAKFRDQPGLQEILCAAECGLARSGKKAAVAKVLQQYWFLIDDKETLPVNGAMLSCMLGAAELTRLIEVKSARDKWQDRLLERARENKDPELFNVLAHLCVGSSKFAEVEASAWEVTGQERFAAGLLTERSRNSELTLDSPELLRAMKEFPENGIVVGMAVRLTAAAGKPLEPILIQAIKAEFTRFSPQGILSRPGTAIVRAYFRKLGEELKLGDDEGE